MNSANEQTGKRPTADILFSRSVKAGKRMYYIDVKRDRNGESYLSITESKRVRDGDGMVPPLFEKHKIFLYNEDLERFVAAFNETVGYMQGHMPEAPADEADKDLGVGLADDDFAIEF